MKGWDWTLSKGQRQSLEAELAQTRDVATYRRIWALLEVNQGRSVAEVARLLRVDRSSIYRWGQRFAAQGKPADLQQQPGQGRPPEWNEDLAALAESALGQPPFQLGYPANTWNAPLLQAYLQFYLPEYPVSISTVRRHVAELGYRWKRFRHRLAPDPQAEKKTPAPAPDSSLAYAHGPAGRGRNRSAALPARAGWLGSAKPTRQCVHFRFQRQA